MRPRESEAMVVLARGDAELASWPLGWGWRRPGLEVVEELARFQLIAQRLGCSIRLRDPCAELIALIDLVGLGDVLLDDARLRSEAGGEIETGE